MKAKFVRITGLYRFLAYFIEIELCLEITQIKTVSRILEGNIAKSYVSMYVLDLYPVGIISGLLLSLYCCSGNNYNYSCYIRIYLLVSM